MLTANYTVWNKCITAYPGTEERLYFRLGTPFFPLLECKFSQKLLIKPLILGKARAWVPYRFRRPCANNIVI